MDFDQIAKAFIANMKIEAGPGSKIQELIDYASMALQGAYGQGAKDENEKIAQAFDQVPDPVIAGMIRRHGPNAQIPKDTK